MSVVKINAVDVEPAKATEFEERFAKRAGAVENQPGFEAFELLRPTDGGTRYFVYTRWASEEAFGAWVASQDFAAAHAHVVAESAGEARPVAHGAELLAFEVVERVESAAV
jgi:heme-degrading monooxygenase HmoA